MGGQHQIVGLRMYLNIPDQCVPGYVVLHPEPFGAAVNAAEQAHLRAQEEQVLVLQVFPDLVREARELIALQHGPCLAHVGRTCHIGLMVTVHMIVKGGIDHILAETGRLDAADPGLRGDAGCSHIFRHISPGLAAIGGVLQIAVIGTHPDDVLVQRGFRY